MKKIGLVIILVMLMIVPATAQITWGVRGGLAYSSLVQKIDNNYQSGARFGFSVAGLAQIPLYKRLSLQPEVAFVHQGGNYLSKISEGDGTDLAYPKTCKSGIYLSVYRCLFQCDGRSGCRFLPVWKNAY